MTEMLGTGICTRRGLKVEILLGHNALLLTQLSILFVQRETAPAGRRRAGFEDLRVVKRDLV